MLPPAEPGAEYATRRSRKRQISPSHFTRTLKAFQPAAWGDRAAVYPRYVCNPYRVEMISTDDIPGVDRIAINPGLNAGTPTAFNVLASQMAGIFFRHFPRAARHSVAFQRTRLTSETGVDCCVEAGNSKDGNAP
jgi:hypothetical protein